jgi:hypothetical protein
LIDRTRKSKEWLGTEQFVAAAKLYFINIFVCNPIQISAHHPTGWRWELFSPHVSNSLRELNQDLDIPSIFIRFINNNHYHVINRPEV